jgi:hypothetical protein
MERLKFFLEKSLKGLNLEGTYQVSRVFGAWGELVGPLIAQHTKPRFFRQGVLIVEVSSAAWANELTMLKPGIMQALEKRLGRGLIREIRWQVAPPYRPGTPYAGPETPTDLLRREIVLPELAADERAAIAEGVTGKVRDPELAETVAGFLETLARRRKAREREGARACRDCGCMHRDDGDRCPICRLKSR